MQGCQELLIVQYIIRILLLIQEPIFLTNYTIQLLFQMKIKLNHILMGLDQI